MQPQRFALFILGLFLIILASLGGVPRASAEPPLPRSADAVLGQNENRNVEAVGQFGGYATTVAVQGNYAYVGIGTHLNVLEVSDPAQPLLVGQSSVLPFAPNDIVVIGNYAYVAATDVYILDLSDPSAPTLVGTYQEPTNARAVRIEVVGDYAFVAVSPLRDSWGPTTGTGLRILDISNPAVPTSVSFSWTEDAVDVAVAGDYAYVLDGYPNCSRQCNVGYLRIIDISNPAAPVGVSVYTTRGWSDQVEVAGDYAYVSTQFGLEAIDISDPAAPVQASFGGAGTDGRDMVISDSHLYVSEHDRVDLYSLSNPGTPAFIEGFTPEGKANGLAVAENLVFVASDRGGLRILDFTDPMNPVEIASHNTSGYLSLVAAAGNYAYVNDADAEGFWIVNVADLSAPTEVGFYDLAEIESLIAVGDHLYVLSRDTQRLHVLSLADPAAPQQVDSIEMGANYGGQMEVDGDRLFVREYDAGIHIFDISEPSAPVAAGTIPIGEHYQVQGEYLYRAAWSSLLISNISDPSNPEEVGRYDTDLAVMKVTLLGNYVYLTEAASEAGGFLYILDISNPSEPTLVGSFDIPPGVVDVVGEGTHVYFAWRDVNEDGPEWTRSGVGVLDVSNPAEPELVGFYDGGSYHYLDLELYNHSVLTAHGILGMEALRFAPPSPTALTLGNLGAGAGGSTVPFAVLGTSLVALAVGRKWFRHGRAAR
ncbi:MAG TPA: hypothetical protein VF707_00110 [Ardenticatenaceae bacterium]